ncbi:hypothetical protein [Parasegetibacter sp. NRK P23]|uniref:hypothetical protein n=1 Tax=Parasegetibacter sp. NRK P23 TaxID=2942999 RepID=UPI0020445070|nr:hypothetical protein [Parasegetibacter sp. NRK P23]MCM5528160.1 hypothetical protein [Parasegetibacter sp. NRK P23]
MKQMLLLLALFSLALVSCEKEELLPGKSAGFVFVHASDTTGSALVTLSGEEVVRSGLNYGESTATTDQPYIFTASGIRNVLISSEEKNVVAPYNTLLSENRLFSCWLYDTLQANGKRSPNVLQLTDQLFALNDSTHFRFLHLATGKNEVALRLVRATTTDTLVVGGLKSLPLNNANTTSLATFSHFLKEGDFKVELIDNTGAILQTQPGFTVAKGTYTTFYTSGAYNSSAPVPFSLNFIQHR